MAETNADERLIAVWVAMAEHFLDTETRHHIPTTAITCVDAGLSVVQAEHVWCFHVSPVVAPNLWSVAGEWALWDRQWLIAGIERERARKRPAGAVDRWWYRLRVQGMHGVWLAIASAMRSLLRVPPHERAMVVEDWTQLARGYLDFAPHALRGDSALVERLRSRAPELMALMAHCVDAEESRTGHVRLRAMLGD